MIGAYVVITLGLDLTFQLISAAVLYTREGIHFRSKMSQFVAAVIAMNVTALVLATYLYLR